MKKLISLGLAGLIALATGCAKMPTSPITQRTINSNQTMFANPGQSYNLFAQNTQKTPVKIYSKLPCATDFVEGSTINMIDGCFGDLELKLTENDYDVPLNSTSLKIYPGEYERDVEMSTVLNTYVGPNPKNILNWDANSPVSGFPNNQADFIVDRNDGKRIYGVVVGNNVEESTDISYLQTLVSPGDIVVKVNQDEDINEKLYSYFH